MKKIYWRPQGMPVFAFVVVALFSMSGLAAVEYFQSVTERPHFEEKLKAAILASKAMAAVREERLRRDIFIDSDSDPAASGLIGLSMSPVTSHTGDLDAKQTSVNPNFAAVIVELLFRAGIREGDPVAVSVTGSFPALNISAYSAITVMKLNPTIIASLASSQWGADEPEFLWSDMETLLYKKGFFPFRSAAATLGGADDMGGGLTDKGKTLLIEGIKRSGIEMISSSDVSDSIDIRMEKYFAANRPRALINVGGGVASTGIRTSRAILKPGLLTELSGELKADSVISRFLKDEKLPVIHLENVKQLARAHGLSVNPHTPQKTGEGEVYYQYRYNLWLTGFVLAGIVFGLYIFGRVDWGFRMLRSAHTREVGPPEPMV